VNIIEIKKVTLEDVEELQKISRETFFETFAGENTAKDMQNYLEENFSRDNLKNELTNPDSKFYFAIVNNIVTGYLKVNSGPAQTELKDDNALEIERIYVLKEYHGKHVGQALYKQALKVAEQKKSCYVWLGVWEKNLRAINFYRKNGFVEFDKHLFKLGEDEQIDLMMKKTLNSQI
jgi:diamine N-acetyltransferase